MEIIGLDGGMMAIMKMKELCSKIGSGATPRGGKEAYVNSGISLIRSQNVLDLAFSYDGLVYINEDQAEKLNNVIVESGDVLLNITGDSVARVCMVEDDILPARVNQHVAIIRANDKLALGSYLLYYLKMAKPYLLQLAAGGATRNALTKGMIEELELEIPSIEEQKRIVSLIDDIQRKIRANEEVNENLLQQARTLYQSWFVDFEPFNGDRPSDWIDGTIDELAKEIICGKTPSTKVPEYYGDDIPFITIPDMHGNTYAVTTERYLSSYGAESQRKKTLPHNSICVSCIGTAGLVTLTAQESQTNQQINSIIPAEGYSPYYIYLLMETLSVIINNLGQSGSTIVNLNKAQFGKISVIIPTVAIMKSFDEIVGPMFESILSNQKENIKLAEIRDALLPRLMSGELDVSKLDL